jgi:hypothetical protein
MAARKDDLYDEDFYAWTQDQAAALRRLAAEHWNGPLDLERLAEEVEDLGSERRDAVLSLLERLMLHLLKLEYSPSDRPRRGWLISIRNARSALHRRLTGTLRNAVEQQLADSYDTARHNAALELAEYDERDAARDLPRACPYTLDQLLDRDRLPANRHGLTDEPL